MEKIDRYIDTHAVYAVKQKKTCNENSGGK